MRGPPEKPVQEPWYSIPLSIASSRGLAPLDQSELGPTSASDLVIAPWLENSEPPSPPSPPQKKNTKSSSFSLRPMASQASLFPRARGTSEGALPEVPVPPPSDPKPRGIFSRMRRKASRPNLSKDSFDHSHFISQTPLPPMPSSSSVTPASPTRKRHKMKKNMPPPVPPKDNLEPEITLDTDLDRMEGIIDFSAARAAAASEGRGSLTFLRGNLERWDDLGPLSAADTGRQPGHEWGVIPPSASLDRVGQSPFINPFTAQSLPTGKRKVHPTPLTLPSGSPVAHRLPLPMPPKLNPEEPDPRWDPPQSWAVDGGGEGYPDLSSSDDDLSSPKEMLQENVSVNMRGNDLIQGQPSVLTRGDIGLPRDSYHIRVYRPNGSYHVVSCQPDRTAQDLQHVLSRKLLLTREVYRLYLRQHGRELVLGPKKRPLEILRRNLSNAGYEDSDWLENLGGEDFSFLLRFVFRSAGLGHTQEEEISLGSYERIDLSARGLQTVPIILHHHAPTIVTLNLSKNALVDIPLDFIQSCESLRELRLSDVSLKRVPMSIRHSSSLQRLDISCNRIADIDDAGLHQIPDLTSVKMENNRLESLPSEFARLTNLKFLNISNNKFETFPTIVCEMAALVDLDVSFNTISSFPPNIGNLGSLERLILVGNQIVFFPTETANLVSLRVLDCRRNMITDLSPVCMLPNLDTLRAEHNAIHVLDLSLGPNLQILDASNNSITRLTLADGNAYSLTALDLSHAKLSSLDDLALAQLISLTDLKLDYNQFRSIPDTLCSLATLTHLSCSDNHLAALPAAIGKLENLLVLNVHNNNLKEIPASIWQCKALIVLNATSNLIEVFHDPPAFTPAASPETFLGKSDLGSERKGSNATVLPTRNPSIHTVPPLAQSLRRLYLGDNRLNDDVFHALTVLKELRVLNLSFNQLQEIPLFWLQTLTQLEELYLSGNKLTSLPAEDLHRLQKLTTLFLNGNKLLTLPAELGKVQSLKVLDVGSNVLKYNINNWEFDWNWNFNPHLKYLNLSGNKRLEIKPDTNHRSAVALPKKQNLAEFSGLPNLRVLGLMDVTTLFIPSVPDENEDRRVRTSFSEVNGMAYGIADTLGNLEHLSMFDLVVPRFRSRDNECLFGMFGRAQAFASNNQLSKYLHEHFTATFIAALKGLNKEKNHGVSDALRRAFLSLNKTLYDYLNPPNSGRKLSYVSFSTRLSPAPPNVEDPPSLKCGASAVVVYMVDKTMYVANAGNALAVVSRQGSAQLLSVKHDPFDRNETARIRDAEGWVSPKGKVNDEVDISRSFGMYHLLPAVNARPHVYEWPLSDQDEFVIVGNRGLWDYVSYQTAVDIARSSRDDPMIAAQKLRDFAISYGAEGSTMIMVISVGDLFTPRLPRARLPTIERPPPRRPNIDDARLARLPHEVPPPTGQLALVFTDIRNSTSLWEKNTGMSTAMRLHNSLLRRQLRTIGGYEVKTEGDAFMASFHSVLSALLWCLTVQIQLLREDWPLEILESEDGKEILDSDGNLIARGLSVRMGIHWGSPVCEPDPVTQRMDYFGPMVNRAARISASATGGQIMVSQDVVREIVAKIRVEGFTGEHSAQLTPDFIDNFEMQGTIEAIRRMGPAINEVGEVKMKGLEMPELLSLVYPRELAGRQNLNPDGPRVPFSVGQIRELAMLCIRLEALSTSRVFRPISEQGSTAPLSEDAIEVSQNPFIFFANPDLLMPPISNKSNDELLAVLDSLSSRIENALSSLTIHHITQIASTLGTVGAADLSRLLRAYEPFPSSHIDILD